LILKAFVKRLTTLAASILILKITFQIMNTLIILVTAGFAIGTLAGFFYRKLLQVQQLVLLV